MSKVNVFVLFSKADFVFFMTFFYLFNMLQVPLKNDFVFNYQSYNDEA